MVEKNVHLSIFGITFLLLGAMVGAGIASGQEILKVFSSYGKQGLFGLVLAILLLALLSLMILKLSYIKQSIYLDEVISPTSKPWFKKIVSIITIYCFFLFFVSMVAAGSSVFEQQLGFPEGIGSFIIAILAVVTVIIGFTGMAKIMPVIVPLVMLLILIISVLVITRLPAGPAFDYTVYQSPLTPNWFVAVIIFVSYYFLGTLPILSTVSVITGNSFKAKAGALIGIFLMGGLALLVYFSLSNNLQAAGMYDMPMVYFAGCLHPYLSIIYSMVLLVTIYSSGMSCLFGATRHIKPDNPKKRAFYIILCGISGYLISLIGYANMVTYLFPTLGYSCMLLLGSSLIAYYKYVIKKQPFEKSE